MVTHDSTNNSLRFYLNGQESDARFGHGVESPLIMKGNAKRYGGVPYYLGVKNPNEDNFFYGKVAQVGMWNRVLSDEEIESFYSKDISNCNDFDGCVLNYDFSNVDENYVYDISGNNNHGHNHECEITNEELDDVSHTIVPYRRNGRFKSLKHPINGIVNNISKNELSKRNLGQDIPILLNFLPNVVTTSDAGAGIGYTGIRIRGIKKSN